MPRPARSPPLTRPGYAFCAWDAAGRLVASTTSLGGDLVQAEFKARLWAAHLDPAPHRVEIRAEGRTLARVTGFAPSGAGRLRRRV